MNQQNISNVPAKRKRGRPRKDESLPRDVKQHTQSPVALVATPPPPTNVIIQQPLATTIIPSTNNLSKVDHSMVGQAVTCVIDGIFDNGYLLSTRLGPNNSILRGIVFQQGHVTPITPANDVAPHVEMYTRGEFQIPPSNPSSIQLSTPQSVCEKHPAQHAATQNYQNTTPMVTGGSSTSAPQESLRLVEQDDIMQVFEVSKTMEEPQVCVQENKKEHVVPEPELITPVEAATIGENQPSKVNDGLQQESQEQTGEVSNVGVNRYTNQQVVVDLSLSNIPEI